MPCPQIESDSQKEKNGSNHPVNKNKAICCPIDLQCSVEQTADRQGGYPRMVQIAGNPIRHRQPAKSQPEKRENSAGQRKNECIEHEIGVYLVAEILIDCAKQDAEQGNEKIEKTRFSHTPALPVNIR